LADKLLLTELLVAEIALCADNASASQTGGRRDSGQVNRAAPHYAVSESPCHLFPVPFPIHPTKAVWLYPGYILPISQPGRSFADPGLRLQLYFDGSPCHLRFSLQLTAFRQAAETELVSAACLPALGTHRICRPSRAMCYVLAQQQRHSKRNQPYRPEKIADRIDQPGWLESCLFEDPRQHPEGRQDAQPAPDGGEQVCLDDRGAE
jgi:hypothetical protein